MLDKKSYVIISACRNESGYIDGLIDCIAAQTIRPTRWLIVDDGSTDDMNAKALARAKELPFIEVVKMPGGRPRSFSSQVYAAQHGYELVKDSPWDFIGFLDGDIRVEPHYYETLMSKFAADRKLGLAGGAVIDQYDGYTEDIRKGSEEYHVAGGVQFFKRDCFEKIGGYVAIDGGGQDSIADIMSLMFGWKLRVFSELKAMHLRPDGFAKDNTWQRGKKWGRKFYLLGYHPVFYFAQCLRRVGRKPFLWGSLCQFLGFVFANVRAEKRPVSDEFVQFIRQLQMKRLRQSLGGRRLDEAASNLPPAGGRLATG